MSYQHFCEACVRASPLNVDKTTLNRIGRQREKDERSGTRYRVVSRSEDGKPLAIGYTRRPDGVTVGTLAGCVCACTHNNHEPLVCTGTRDHIVGGPPGSGVLDKLADQLGADPIPEITWATAQAPKIGSQLTPRILCGRTVDRSRSRALCAAQAGHWPEHGDRWGRVTVRLSRTARWAAFRIVRRPVSQAS